jgi:peptidoglycan-associated lipoprotein
MKSLKNKEQEANQVYKVGELLRSAHLYEETYRGYGKYRTTDKSERAIKNEARAKIAFKIGRIYHTIRDLNRASTWYNSAIRLKYHEVEPKVFYYLAKVFQQLGKIEQAEELYSKFLQKEPEDILGKNGLKSCKIIQKWETDVEESDFREIEYKRKLNSTGKDYALSVGDSEGWELYFTSNRKGTDSEDNEVYGELFTNIFYTKKNSKGKWSEIEPISNTSINTLYSDGTPSFSADFSTMFYTHCAKRTKDKNPCAIFYASRSGDSWGNSTELKIRGTRGYSIGHPSINGAGDTLYFSSDLKGGYGGKDIWYTVKADSGWSAPVNMGELVNTSMDEVFPYIRKVDNKFFFSSSGHLGMGGLDIFELNYVDGQKVVNNLKAPLNSRADDFGISFDKVERYYHTGYFSSNRKYNAKNDDIYSFARYPKEYLLRVYVFDAETFEPVEDARVKIAGTNGTDKNDILTNERGMVNIPLSEETKYIYAARKKDYLIDIGYSSTKGMENDYEDIYDTLMLVSTKKPIVIPNIFYKKNSANYFEESEKSLEELYKVMKQNPEIKVELRAHSDFAGRFEHNLNLSQRRAEVVVDYLKKRKIPARRMVAVGKGETEPLVIDQKLIDQYEFLSQKSLNQKLDSVYIVKLAEEFQEVAKSLNRRTDLKVINN